jgi:hypothetical protein
MLIAVLIVTLAVLAVGWLLPRDPTRVLARYARSVARVERVPAPDLGAEIERWRVITTAGDTAKGLWRRASPRVTPPWTVVLLGGLVTGDRAATLLPSDAPAHVLAMDWPWSGARRLSIWGILARLPEIRRAALSSPATLALGVEAALRVREADSTRVAVLGASLGVPPAVASLRLTRSPRALILIDGAADLESVLLFWLRARHWPDLLAIPTSAAASWLIRPLEPSVHAGKLPRVPVLIVNSKRDELLPARAVARLHAVFPQAQIRWRSGGHLRPRPGEVIAALAHQVGSWLEALEQPSAARAPPLER